LLAFTRKLKPKIAQASMKNMNAIELCRNKKAPIMGLFY